LLFNVHDVRRSESDVHRFLLSILSSKFCWINPLINRNRIMDDEQETWKLWRIRKTIMQVMRKWWIFEKTAAVRVVFVTWYGSWVTACLRKITPIKLRS
jgi:hypothetical protein